MKIIRIIPALLFPFWLSCKKESPGVKEVAAVNIVNATADSGPVKIKLGADASFTYLGVEQIDEGYGKFIYAAPGLKPITAVAADDVSTVFFEGNLNLSMSAPVSTLYLAGQLPNIDTLLQEELALPLVSKNGVVRDSLLYIRFVNLCVNSTPLTFKVNPDIEVSGLAYKGVSAFKSCPALGSAPSYTVEVSDASNTIIATYDLDVAGNRFKTLSLVIKGLAGTTDATAPSVFPVFYYN